MKLLLESLALLLVGRAPVDLGSPSWRVREDATSRLAAVGVWAVPALAPLAASPDPEVRRRAVGLLAPWQRRWDRARAWWLLVDTRKPDIVSVYRDHTLRYHLWEIDRSIYGGSDCRFDPSHDGGAFECWQFGEYPWSKLETAIDIVRVRIRTGPYPTSK